jgi:hypothetical protein
MPHLKFREYNPRDTDWRYREDVYRLLRDVMRGIHFRGTGVTVAG